MADYDIVIIGGGSAGFSAAREAASLGADVVLIDGSDPFGGTCILRGCMPSKTLIHCANVAHDVATAGEFGVEVGDVQINYPKMHARTKLLVDEWARYRFEQVIANPKITLIREWAQFVDDSTIRAGEELIHSERFIITTGSRPRIPVVPGLPEAGFITSDEALWLERLPESLVALGAGPIGLEIGQYMNRLGVDVTILEKEERLLLGEDSDVAAVLRRALERDGIQIHTCAMPHRVESFDGGKRVLYGNPEESGMVEAEEILVSAGRIANTQLLRLDAAGVMVDALGDVVVDNTLRTTNPNVYSAGDVTGHDTIVHCAVSHGAVAARNALVGEEREAVDCRLKLQIIFTDPEVATVGVDEQEALRQGRNFLTASYSFADHGKSVIMGKTTGFVKMLADAASGEILGMKIIGPDASNLIHEAAVLLSLHATVQQLSEIAHYHPTLAEIITYPGEELAAQIKLPERPVPAWI